MEAAVYQEEAAFKAELAKKKRRLQNLAHSPHDVGDERFRRLSDVLSSIEASRPLTIPLILWLAMGNIKLILSGRERLTYKASYEQFKMFATITHLTLNIILLLLDQWCWLDATSNFFLLYTYSAMTLREHVLRSNGSSMQRWWVWHHYLCVVLAGVMVVWPAGGSYYQMRTHLLVFGMWTAAVQLLQYKYQMGRLYTLRALSRVSPMQMTTDSASVHIFNTLGFLLPFLLLGHTMQFYTSYRFLKLSMALGWVEWQLTAIGLLFGAIGTGNITTTIYTLYLKWRNRRKPATKVC